MGKELLELAYESAKEIPGAERCVLRLLDEQTSELTLRARLGLGEKSRLKRDGCGQKISSWTR